MITKEERARLIEQQMMSGLSQSAVTDVIRSMQSSLDEMERERDEVQEVRRQMGAACSVQRARAEAAEADAAAMREALHVAMDDLSRIELAADHGATALALKAEASASADAAAKVLGATDAGRAMLDAHALAVASWKRDEMEHTAEVAALRARVGRLTAALELAAGVMRLKHRVDVQPWIKFVSVEFDHADLAKVRAALDDTAEHEREP